MAGPTRDAIDTFMRITGASESLAVHLLQECRGNLDEAVNAHFNYLEANRANLSPELTGLPLHNTVDMNSSSSSQVQSGQKRGLLPILSAARSFKPSLLLDPNYRRDLWSQIGGSVVPGREPSRYSPTYNQWPHHSSGGPYVDGSGGTSLVPVGSHAHGRPLGDGSAHLYGNDMDEEEIFRSVIEASRQEAMSGTGLTQMQIDEEDDELARALSLSLTTAEQEKKTSRPTMEDHKQKLGVPDSSGGADKTNSGVPKGHSGSSSSAKGPEHAQDQSLWGAISSDELDEAMILETALFGEHASRLDSSLDKRSGQSTAVAGEESERPQSAKKDSLPQEPAPDHENVVNLLVRMPDGSRCGRRFLKSDKLKCLFDFIDVGGAVKPATYRLVRPYPRRAFSVEDSSLSLNELGLTNKQEALFLELV